MPNFNDNDELIQYLIMEGGIEVAGIDSETGEFLYTFTDKLKDINPKVYQAMLEDFHGSVMRLWQEGFLSMDITLPNPIVNATEKIFDQDAVNKLSKEDRMSLQDILNKMSE